MHYFLILFVRWLLNFLNLTLSYIKIYLKFYSKINQQFLNYYYVIIKIKIIFIIILIYYFINKFIKFWCNFLKFFKLILNLYHLCVYYLNLFDVV